MSKPLNEYTINPQINFSYLPKGVPHEKAKQHIDRHAGKQYNIQYPISNIQYHTTLRSKHLLHSIQNQSKPSYHLLPLLFLSLFGLFLPACSPLANDNNPPANDNNPPAVKYTVSFQTDGGNTLSPVEVTGGSTLSKAITAPTKTPSGSTNYYFGDWYTVPASAGHTGKTKYDYTRPVTGNLTLYARWYTEQPVDRSALDTLLSGLGDTGNFNHIDVRGVPDMRRLFHNRDDFNGDISGWDTSKVSRMDVMFRATRAFNQPIGDWDTSKVTDMSDMFFDAQEFNQPLANWNTSQVENMKEMFTFAAKFNQNLDNWDTSNVLGMRRIFGSTPLENNKPGWCTGTRCD
ncbi:BspA family leucine-rich repeat surface protein [Candidatus Haliotispira prima]|uniref:BspA family leucine-rich repeat surface protein n=1 Tax=Candidatus Haliotispira prima TaxID=3034016 RepID=A0ABY8MFR5_9SPIO|nr:BspA family leucine-rich repeat surface protein [Candidatus Haliotispira prima]